MVGIGDPLDVTEGRGAWQETFSGFLPMRIEVRYGSGKAFSADKEQKTKMEANVLEAAVGELLASKDDACIALARLISVLCGLCALYPPANLPPSNRHMLFKYASKICSPVLCRLDRWIDEELLKCDWLTLEIVCLIPELYNWKVPEPHKIGDGQDPGIPDTPELMLEGESPLNSKLRAIRATRDKFKLQSSGSGDPAEDAAGYPSESTPEAKGDPGDRTGDGPPASWGRKERQNTTFGNTLEQETLELQALCSVTMSCQDMFLKLPDGSWTCLLCDKVATDEHIMSKKHESNLRYPEGEILKWVAQNRQKHAKPQGASSAAAASERTETIPPAMPTQGAQRPPASWGQAKLYWLNKDWCRTYQG
eukprot:s1062_g5.t1